MADHIFNCRSNRKAENKANLSAPSSSLVPSPQIIQRALCDFSSLSASEILQLQSLLGNQKVAGLMNKMSYFSAENSEEISAKEIRTYARKGLQSQTSKLPYAEKIQKAFGKHDISLIKAHLGTEATTWAEGMQASAYTVGNDIVFADQPGLNLAAHEAAHVIQQRAGVKPAGGIGQNGDPYELNAEAVAARVAAGQSAEDLLNLYGNSRDSIYKGETRSFKTRVDPQACGNFSASLQSQGNESIQMGKVRKTRKSKYAKPRLERLNERGKKRYKKVPVILGKRRDAPTLFGMTGLSRQRFSETDPQTTTRSKDFGNTESVGSKYTDFLPQIGGLENWKVMSKVIDKKIKLPKSITSQQQRAMAMLQGTTHYSEDYRFPGAKKIARSALRKVIANSKKSSKPEDLSDDFLELFPMAKEGGKNVYSDYLEEKKKLSKKQEEVLEEMSDSSDEE